MIVIIAFSECLIEFGRLVTEFTTFGGMRYIHDGAVYHLSKAFKISDSESILHYDKLKRLYIGVTHGCDQYCLDEAYVDQCNTYPTCLLFLYSIFFNCEIPTIARHVYVEIN